MSMELHVKNICKVSYFHLHNIAKIRKYLTIKSTQLFVQATVTSRLDTCNSLLTGLPAALIHKLQLVQNSAARLIFREKKFAHVTPLLVKLHWLPIQWRIMYKVCLLTYRALHNMGPPYISELISPHRPQRSLRSENKLMLTFVPKNFVKYGDRAFCSVSPKLWNTLPMEIKSSASLAVFKSALKTYYFRAAYPDLP